MYYAGGLLLRYIPSPVVSLLIGSEQMTSRWLYFWLSMIFDLSIGHICIVLQSKNSKGINILVSFTFFFSSLLIPRSIFMRFSTDNTCNATVISFRLSMSLIHPVYFPSNNALNFAFTLKYAILNLSIYLSMYPLSCIYTNVWHFVHCILNFHFH